MRPDYRQHVIIYDGECPFCLRQIERIRRRDTDNAFDYLPRQAPGLTERHPRLADEDFNTGMRLITANDEYFIGADAVYQIARRIPVWRKWAVLYRIPGIHRLARRAYAWVAAHRRALGNTCEGGQCRIDSKTP